MRGGRILWGQIGAVFTIVLVMVWAATQWTAFRLGFQPQLGAPWFELAGLPVGDVLLDFNGQAITDSDSLKQFLASQDPQQVFRMRYFRNGVQADAVFTVRGGVL